MPQSSSVPMTLVMQRGPHPNLTYALEKDVLILGRDASADISINDQAVSRFHARLTRQGSQWVVEDIGSSNGTFVNGQRISGPTVLSPGAQLGLGSNVVLGVQLGAPAYAAAPRARGGGGLGWGVLGAVIVLAALLLIGAGVAAYFFLLNPSVQVPSLQLTGAAALDEGPIVSLQDPEPGTRLGAGERVLVFATARDAQRVTRLDLWINDVLVMQQASPVPEGVTPLSLVYEWTPTEAGVHYLMVRAYDSQAYTGESPLVAVTVSADPAPPEQALHVVQPGDTVDSLAAQMGVSAADVRAANPSVSGDVIPGQVVALPAPRSAVASSAGAAPAPAAAKAGGAAGAAGAAGAGPAALGPPPPPPPNASLQAPTLIGLKATDCQVTVAWQDNTEGEDGFGVLRAALGQPGFQTLQPLIGKMAGKGGQQQFVDTVPGPGSYVYMVAAGTVGGLQARSSPHTIVVPATAACVVPPTYKQVVFQPLTVKAPNVTSMNLYFDVGHHIFRRVPTQGHLAPGDWSANKQTIPAPVFLKPGDPLGLAVTGEERARKVSKPLGSFFRSFTPAELDPNRQWQDRVAASGLEVTYRLWLEDVVWGQGANQQMPPPTDLRLATAAEMNAMAGCAGGKCDSKVDRGLMWNWAGNLAQVEGYLLLRKYNCGGKETQSTDVIVGAVVDGWVLRSGSEPAGCDASYQVSAYGPAGVSPPSQALDVPAAGPPPGNLAVAFKKFGVKGALSGSDVVQVAFQVNDQLVKSANVVLPSMAAQPGSQVLDMSRQFLDGRAPNNRVVIGLKGDDSLQIGFVARVGDKTCSAQQILSLKPGETWAQFQDQDLTLQSADGLCEAEVRLGQSSQPLTAEEKPYAEITVVNIIFTGEGAYAIIRHHGNDSLSGYHIKIVTKWVLKQEPTLEVVGEQIESTQTVSWPSNSNELVLKVAEAGSPRRLINGSTSGDLIQYLQISGSPVDCDGYLLSTAANVYIDVPSGLGCAVDDDCKSEHCANGKCAPEDGTGTGGEYCHHDNHCASGLCVCPDGWESGSAGFCKGWQQFNLFGTHGVCSTQFENGTNCTEDQDCKSGYCADGKKCAPKAGTGEAGDYCHHDNQCRTGLCLCPDGWIGGSGPCVGWETFSARDGHGTCTEVLPDGAGCTEDRDCRSGYCADGKKCAPKDGTGEAGDYCHHDNHCVSGSCDCPGEDVRVMGAKSFCPDWESFTITQHGVCRALAENGARCTRDEQCESGYCADGAICAPKDGTGAEGDYCHHDNQCASGMCDCPGEDFRVMGAKSFCPDWETFTVTVHGVCRSLNANGDGCTRDAQCASGYCADGKKCAPEDGTGGEGDYCHHNNHCQTRVCDCPDGTDWLGFCKGWESFTAENHATCQVY
jgi:LysM repeat protein